MSFQVSAPSRETEKLSDSNGNHAGNQVETVSLKALARKVLRGNHEGNFMETATETSGNFEGKKEAKVSKQFPGEKPPLAIVTCRHCGARYWHHLGHLATDGKIAGGQCCFGHEVLTVAKHPTKAEARQAYPWPEDAGEPEHGACCKCGTDTTACTTYPDGRLEWICKRCYSDGARPLPDTQKAVTGEMLMPL